jgi:uncharacterized protein YbjT (DUF2867 family)
VRWFVTGATGFIGTTLIEQLLARGDEVRALVRDVGRASELRAMGADLVRGDVARPDSLAEAVPDVDVVVHLAGIVKAVSRAEFFSVNVEGTRSLARVVARSARAKFVLVSSLAAAGPSTPGRPRVETDRPAPVSIYGQSKLAAEDALRAFAPTLDASIIRPPIVYGPRDKEFLPSLFRLARTGVVAKSGTGRRGLHLGGARPRRDVSAGPAGRSRAHSGNHHLACRWRTVGGCAPDRAPCHPLPRQDDGDSRAGVDLLLRESEAGTRVGASRFLRRRDEGLRQVVPRARTRLTFHVTR